MQALVAVSFDTAFFLDQLRPDGFLLDAVWLTVVISVVSQFIGTMIGVLSATAAMSRYAAFRALAGLYTWVFRGTPVLLQIVFWFYGSNLVFGFTLIPRELELGSLVIEGAIVAGIIALSLNEGAYMSEIVRAGILSVDDGQLEAGLVVGLTEAEATRRIVLPQAARLIVPGLGNEFNNMLKTSALVSVIGVTELFAYGQQSYSTSFKYLEVFAAVALWYLLLTTVWMLIQVQLERALGRHVRHESESVLQRLFGAGQRRRTYS